MPRIPSAGTHDNLLSSRVAVLHLLHVCQNCSAIVPLVGSLLSGVEHCKARDVFDWTDLFSQTGLFAQPTLVCCLNASSALASKV